MGKAVPQLRQCIRCGEEHGLSHFRFNHGNHENTCRTCRSLLRHSWRKDNMDRERSVRRAYASTTHGRSKILLRNMQHRSEKEKWCAPEFTIEEIVTAIDGQSCSKTGIPFDLETSFSRTNPFTPSPDRIDSSLGYTKANVQWVCWMYNIMKSDFTPEAVEIFISSLLLKHQQT